MICPKCSKDMPLEKMGAKWCTTHQEFHDEKGKPRDGEFVVCFYCLELLTFTTNATALRTLTNLELYDAHSKYGRSIGKTRRLIAAAKAEKEDKTHGRTRRPDGLD